MEAAEEHLRFFVDRGIGSRVVPGALRDAGWALVTMDERYGTQLSQRTEDVDWIGDAAQRGEISICKDSAISYNYDEARTIYMNEARVRLLQQAVDRAADGASAAAVADGDLVDR